MSRVSAILRHLDGCPTYDKSSLDEPDGHGVVEEGVRVGDDSDGSVVFSLSRGAKDMRRAMHGAPELEVSNLADRAIRFGVDIASVLCIVFAIEVASGGEREIVLERDVLELGGG